MKAFNALLKPSKAPQRSVKIKIKLFFFFYSGIGTLRVNPYVNVQLTLNFKEIIRKL